MLPISLIFSGIRVTGECFCKCCMVGCRSVLSRNAHTLRELRARPFQDIGLGYLAEVISVYGGTFFPLLFPHKDPGL
uniref:Uncharacterized protein n=1 Tax=Rhizophora mucronata TaxID=61149 RepID=A0A2P2QRC2_RHIMU